MDTERTLSLEVHQEFVKRVEQHQARQDKRIEGLEERYEQIYDLNLNVQKMVVSLEGMAAELSKQGERLEEIEKEPAKAWKKFMWMLFAALVGGALVIIGQNIGLPM